MRHAIVVVIPFVHVQSASLTINHLDRLNYATTILNTPSNDLPHPVATVIQLVLLEGLIGDLDTKDVARFFSVLSSRRLEPSSADVASIIVDLFWVMEVEIEVDNESRATNSGRLEKLCALAKDIIVRSALYSICTMVR